MIALKNAHRSAVNPSVIQPGRTACGEKIVPGTPTADASAQTSTGTSMSRGTVSSLECKENSCKECSQNLVMPPSYCSKDTFPE